LAEARAITASSASRALEGVIMALGVETPAAREEGVVRQIVVVSALESARTGIAAGYQVRGQFTVG
jgi:hypothetical protein